MPQIHGDRGEIAADEVWIPALECGRRRDGTGDNAIAETGGETFDLTLDSLEAIGSTSIRDMAIGPCCVVTCGSAGGVEE